MHLLKLLLLAFFLFVFSTNCAFSQEVKCVIQTPDGKKHVINSLADAAISGTLTAYDDGIGSSVDESTFPLTEEDFVVEPRYELKFSAEENFGDEEITRTKKFNLELGELATGAVDVEGDLGDTTVDLPFSRLIISNYAIAGGDLMTTIYNDDLMGPFKQYSANNPNRMRIFLREIILDGEGDIESVTGAIRVIFKTSRTMQTARFNQLRKKFGIIDPAEYRKKISADSQNFGRVKIICTFSELPYTETSL